MSDLNELCETLNKEANKKIKEPKDKSDILILLVVLGLSIFAMCLSFGVGIWVMIAGWGLTPQSWPIIIIGLLVQVGIVCVSTFIQSYFK